MICWNKTQLQSVAVNQSLLINTILQQPLWLPATTSPQPAPGLFPQDGKSVTPPKGGLTMLITIPGRLHGLTQGDRPLSALWAPTDRTPLCSPRQSRSLGHFPPAGKCVSLRRPASISLITIQRRPPGMTPVFLRPWMRMCRSISVTLGAN